MKLSVIIANHNYRDYVDAAIASALAVDWPDKEVIVVDDASTDDSRRVIKGFGNSIAAHFRPKSHQLGAHKFGFAQSRGDVVILLDADDMLEPEVMREVAEVWRPGISKVQYRMALIGASGAQFGTAIPQFPPKDDPERLRRSYVRTLDYTTPPGSGNAYARNFVKRAYAMAPPTMRWSDDVLVMLAPMLGDVLTIRKPLARYRIHGGNDGALTSLDAAKFRRRLLQDIEKARLFETAFRQLHPGAPHGGLEGGLGHLQYRLASLLVEPSAHPFAKDTVLKLTYRLLFSAATSSQMRFRDRAVLLAWAVSSALAPEPLRTNLVSWRFAPTSRPALIKRLLAGLTSLRSPRLPEQAQVMRQ